MRIRPKRAHDGTLVTQHPTSAQTSNTSQAKSTIDGVDTESVKFMDSLFGNRLFWQILSTRDILNIKIASKTWAQWTNENANNHIIDARISDDSRDWYFPLFGPTDVEVEAGSLQLVPTLQGMWHATSNGLAVSELGKLPDLLYLPPPLTFSVCICNPQEQERKEAIFVVRASLGGLLLVETRTRLIRTNCSRNDLTVHVDHDRHCSIGHTHWQTLLVTNPLTKQFQVLPNAEVDFRRWGRKLNYFMMVDEVTNNYKVLIIGKHIFENSNLYLYDSMSMKWEVVHDFDRHMQPPLGKWMSPMPPSSTPYLHSRYYASVCASGRLYLADIRMPNDTGLSTVTAVVRLFEVDIQSGQWVLRTELPFCKTYNGGVQIQHIDKVDYDTQHVHRNLELVECMGKLYAITPARLDEILHEPYDYTWANVDTKAISSKYLPLQFYIFQLTGEVEVEKHGVMRIETPTRNCSHLGRRLRLFKRSTINLKEHYAPGVGNWFSCTARGSIIWVSIDEYLLQYDVVSRECKTEIIPKGVLNQEKVGVAYRASFHMKP